VLLYGLGSAFPIENIYSATKTGETHTHTHTHTDTLPQAAHTLVKEGHEGMRGGNGQSHCCILEGRQRIECKRVVWYIGSVMVTVSEIPGILSTLSLPSFPGLRGMGGKG
jgi:hypothetical protein